MSDHFLSSVVTVATAIVGLAILAVIVSKGSNTAGVLSSAGSAFSSILRAAVGPASGGTFNAIGGASLPSVPSIAL